MVSPLIGCLFHGDEKIRWHAVSALGAVVADLAGRLRPRSLRVLGAVVFGGLIGFSAAFGIEIQRSEYVAHWRKQVAFYRSMIELVGDLREGELVVVGELLGGEEEHQVERQELLELGERRVVEGTGEIDSPYLGAESTGERLATPLLTASASGARLTVRPA